MTRLSRDGDFKCEVLRLGLILTSELVDIFEAVKIVGGKDFNDRD